MDPKIICSGCHDSKACSRQHTGVSARCEVCGKEGLCTECDQWVDRTTLTMQKMIDLMLEVQAPWVEWGRENECSFLVSAYVQPDNMLIMKPDPNANRYHVVVHEIVYKQLRAFVDVAGVPPMSDNSLATMLCFMGELKANESKLWKEIGDALTPEARKRYGFLNPDILS